MWLVLRLVTNLPERGAGGVGGAIIVENYSRQTTLKIQPCIERMYEKMRANLPGGIETKVGDWRSDHRMLSVNRPAHMDEGERQWLGLGGVAAGMSADLAFWCTMPPLRLL